MDSLNEIIECVDDQVSDDGKDREYEEECRSDKRACRNGSVKGPQGPQIEQGCEVRRRIGADAAPQP